MTADHIANESLIRQLSGEGSETGMPIENEVIIEQAEHEEEERKTQTDLFKNASAAAANTDSQQRQAA